MRGDPSTRLPDLPDELSSLIEGYSLSRYPWYETAAKIYRLESEDVLYLKLIVSWIELGHQGIWPDKVTYIELHAP